MDSPLLQIESAQIGRREVAVREDVALDLPNATLRRWVRPGDSGPPVLVVAPQSGHFSWLMRDTVIGLLSRHDVSLLEWRDGGDIPVEAGYQGLDASIGTVMAAIRHAGPHLAVLGVSQAPVPILAAAALLAAEGAAERPVALVLMGGFIDPRRNPTPVGRLAGRLPPGWFRRVMAVPAPPDRPGAGRLLYPGATHGQALGRYLARHMATGGELYRKVTADDGADPQRFPFARLYSTLMDLPAEFAEDNSRKVFAEAHLPRGLLSWRGRAVEPEALSDTALLTIEGGRDDSSGAGQTHVAQDLCRNIRRRAVVTEPEAGHFGLFHGEPWRSQVLPRVVDFLARQA